MNSHALSDKAKNKAEEYNVTSNLIINHFFFDSIIKRIAQSNYRNNFVLKGGFLLSINLGIKSRTTNDLDFSVNNIEMTDESIIKIFSEIIRIDLHDNIKYEIKTINSMKDDIGIRIKLIAKLEKIRQTINIDIVSGDPITPQVLNFRYKSIIDNDIINIMAYNYETIIAEKLQTVISLGVSSSRSKDLYDLFVISKFKANEIEYEHLKSAVKETFAYRDTSPDLEYMRESIKEIYSSKVQKDIWERYAKNNYFANDISFTEIFESIYAIIDKL